MKRLEHKLEWSIVIHIVWYICVLYFAFKIEGGETSTIVELFGLSKNALISTPIYLVVVYFFEYIVYKHRPLECNKEKIIFWIVTIIMSFMMVVPLLWGYFI